MTSKQDIVTDHWNKKTLHYLIPYLEQGQHLVRIATGFFTIQGYDLIRPQLISKTVNILVGFDESSRERLKQKLIDDIMTHLSRWDANNRRLAVQNLVDKLERGELKVIEQGSPELIDARIRKYDHGKVFILDESAVLVGSSNLTASGLIHNTEAVTCIIKPERIKSWIALFQKYWLAPDTYDLTQALLEALRRWLGLHNPFDIYLKTIQALVPEDDTEAPRNSYKMPVKYQMVIVDRVLRQLHDWRGAMVVASTGLGKTIIATHVAYRLQQAGNIRNVLIFAPKPIHPDWEQAMYSAGLSHKIITRNLLDQRVPPKRLTGKKKEMMEALSRLDEQHLIILDESQYFKNRLQARGKGNRLSFERLVQAINEKTPKVILLTATPLARGVKDLNNQLYLLPWTAPTNWLTTKQQWVMPEFGEGIIEPTTWRVPEKEEFFEDFTKLPVCTVISTSQVAKNFAVHTEDGDYITFGKEQRWIPKIELRKIKIPVLLEHEMGEALDEGYFKHKIQKFKTRDGWRHSEANIENRAIVAWTSSPLALEEVLTKTIDDDYKVDFRISQTARQERLAPILSQVQSLTYYQDTKFLALCECLRQFKQENQKVIIFTEQYATAIYLEEQLAQAIPELKVANTVKRTDTGFEAKDFEKEVLDLILDFAPEANADKLPEGHEPLHYDIFISTDAYGAGVNLQDANVVISYDLAWTADTIIQRAGRILRFWREPRQVHLYVFVNAFQEYTQGQQESGKVEARLQLLTSRTRQAQKFSELPIIPDKERVEYDSLGPLSNVTIEDLGLINIEEAEEFTGVSPFLKHITELNNNLQYIKSVPDDIMSALDYKQKEPKLYLLLRYRGQYYWTLYNIKHKRLEDVKEDQLLDMIQCKLDTPTADIDSNEIEEHAQTCRKLWCHQQEIEFPDENEIERICALYLNPSQTATFRDMLHDTI